MISFVAYEIGFQIGHWYQARTPGVQEGPTGVLVGSILALLAFLLAITMGMASDRFDTRRGLVLEEANPIQTTYLRAGYLPEPASSEIRNLLREYVPLRITPSDQATRLANAQRSEGATAADLVHRRGRGEGDAAGRPHGRVHRVAQRDD